MKSPEILEITEANLDEVGLFCCMSKPESEMYKQKVDWMRARFSEGLRYKIIANGGRGFIEYIPGEVAWRGIHAPRYMVIHCLWVVGKAKGHGCGKALLVDCIADAKRAGMLGVAVVTARHQLGLADTRFFLNQGFQVVAQAPPNLDLATLKFKSGQDPEFLGDWDAKLKALGGELRVVYTSQCPFALGLADGMLKLAKAEGIPIQTVHLDSTSDVRREAPSAYGTFAVTANGHILSHLYHRMTAARLKTLMN